MGATLNLTAELEKLIADITAAIDEFRHIDPTRLLVCVNSSRNSQYGAFAKIHHLRFTGGEQMQVVRRGRSSYRCTMPQISHKEVDILYVIYFTLPRFMERPFTEKLVTIFHELYHISPRFDGDIRRFSGKNFAHGSSAKKYNQLMECLVERYLQLPASAGKSAFLNNDMAALRAKYAVIVGRRQAMPKITVEKL